MSITANIGANMKRRRAQLGLSLQQVADRAGTSKSHIWELEKGRSNPTVAMLIAVADALAINLYHLIGLGASQPLISDDELELIQHHRRIFGRERKDQP